MNIREMKKIEYVAPEMEIIKLAAQRAVLQPISGGSGSTPTTGGSANLDDPDDMP